MLPSFRVIAATFFCGFLVVFAGLRLATSLNDVHAALPVTAAHAAPVAPAEREHGASAVPVMYDLRFAVSTVAKAPPIDVTALVIDRSAPLVIPQPLRIALPNETANEVAAPRVAATDPVKPAEVVASLPPQAADEPADARIEPPKIDGPSGAAIDPQTVPQEAAAALPASDDAPGSAPEATTAPGAVEAAADFSIAAPIEPVPTAPIVAAASRGRTVRAAPRVVRKKPAGVARATAEPSSPLGSSNPFSTPSH